MRCRLGPDLSPTVCCSTPEDKTMTKQARTVNTSVLALGLLAGASVQAAGPIELTECPTSFITEPGKYVLVSDLTVDPTHNACIGIEGSGVTVDLNGHTITGDYAGEVPPNPIAFRQGIKVQQYSSDITVKGPGKIENFGYAIYFDTVTGGEIKQVVAARNRTGLWVFNSTGVEIKESVAFDSTLVGIGFNRTNNGTIKQNESFGNAVGIVLEGESNNCEVKSNNSSSNTYCNIQLAYGDNNLVRQNIALGVAPTDICSYDSEDTFVDNLCETSDLYVDPPCPNMPDFSIDHF